MASAPARIIKAVPIDSAAYRRYGDVIAADEKLPFKPANFGSAKRFNYLGDVLNLRTQTAKLNLCIFQCNAFTEAELSIKMLEKHPHSTQVFMPMQNGRYITIVAEGSDSPDLSTLAAFICDAPVGISYRPGIWHYPMTAINTRLDLACLVFEDDGKGDCIVASLSEPVTIRL